jgi:hypothetical protein
MAKPVRHQRSALPGKFVSIDMFRELESEVSQLRDTLENIRHESSANLRRCGELQFAVDELKKEGKSLRLSTVQH